MKKRNLIVYALAILMILALVACATDTGNDAADPTPDAQEAEEVAPEPEEEAQEPEEAPPAPEPVEVEEGEQVRVVIGFASGYLDEARGGVALAEGIFAQMHYDLPHIEPEIMVMLGADAAAGWGEYFLAIQAMIASGTAPDLFHAAIEGVQTLAQMELISPIDHYLDANPGIRDALWDDVHPNLQNPFILNGETYSVVNDWNNIVVHINTAMLEDVGLELPPYDWDLAMYLEYLSILTREVDGVMQYGTSLPGFYFAYSNWLVNNDANFLSDCMTEVVFDSPESIEVMQLMYDLLHTWQYTFIPEAWDVSLLVEGRIAMVSAGRWPVATYVNSGFYDVAIRPVPKMRSQNVIFGSGGPVVSVTSDVKYEAAQVIVWMAGDPFVSEMYGVSNIPASISIAERIVPIPGVPINPEFFVTSADIAVAVQSPPSYSDLESIFNRYFGAVIAGEISPEEACMLAAEEMRDALRRNPTLLTIGR